MVCGSQAGGHTSHFPLSLMALPSHERSTSPIFPTLCGSPQLRLAPKRIWDRKNCVALKQEPFFSLHTQPVQSPPFTGATLGLSGPYKLSQTHHDHSRDYTSPHMACKHPTVLEHLLSGLKCNTGTKVEPIMI